MDREAMSQVLAEVMRSAGGESPEFIVLPIRDWWFLRRGPRWKFPLPKKRVFQCLPRRAGGVWSRYLRLDPWISGRGRMKPLTPRQIVVKTVSWRSQ